MTAPAFFRKELGGLRPEGDTATAVLGKIKLGDVVKVEIKRPRNLAHHRKFWALMNLVFENQEHYESVENMVAAMKTAVGHCDFMPSKDGNTMIAIPKSIAFHKMDQTEFETFYENCLNVIAKHFIPGIDKDDLRKEVESFLS